MVRNGEPARSAGSGVESGGAGAKSAPRFGITWSDQSVRLLALALAVIAVLWLARGIIGPFVVAGVIAYAFSPVVSAVHSRTRLPRVVIIAIGYVLFLGALAVVAYFAAERAGRELNELTSNGHDIFSTGLHKLLGNTIVIAGNAYSVEELSKQLKDALLGMVSSPTSAVQLAERAVDLALQAILCLIITFYLLLDGHRFGEFALRFLGREQRADTLRLTHRIHTVLGRWLRGQMFLIALVAVVFYVILGPILHVRYALALGILSGVLEIIPLVGPVIAAGGFALLAMADMAGSFLTLLAPMVVLGLGMTITGAPLTTSVINAVPQRQAGTVAVVPDLWYYEVTNALVMAERRGRASATTAARPRASWSRRSTIR